MTENKRFTLKHYEDTDWAYDNGKSIYTKEMVELLNEQEETIQSLKQELFEARKDYLIETADISDTLHLFKLANPNSSFLDMNCGIKNGDRLLNFKEVVDLLNQLNDENEQVKKQLSEQGTQIDFLKDENHHMRTVLEENKQLKQNLRMIEKRADKVYEENEELKKDVRRLHSEVSRMKGY